MYILANASYLQPRKQIFDPVPFLVRNWIKKDSFLNCIKNLTKKEYNITFCIKHTIALNLFDVANDIF